MTKAHNKLVSVNYGKKRRCLKNFGKLKPCPLSLSCVLGELHTLYRKMLK